MGGKAVVRRKLYGVRKATGSTTARTGVSMIDLMYEAKVLRRGLPLEDRLEHRHVVRAGVDGFFNWAEDTMRRISIVQPDVWKLARGVITHPGDSI